VAQQAEQAKQAMTRAWNDLAAGLAQGVNVGEWARDYPWVALGTAAAAGFAASAVFIPSREQQAMKKLAELRRALYPAPRAPAVELDDDEEQEASDKPRRKKTGLLGIALRELMRTLGPTLASAISGAVAVKSAEDSDNNGHPPPAPPAEPFDAPAENL
jgi:hypothetical protein